MKKELEVIEIDQDFTDYLPYDFIAPEKSLLAAILVSALADLNQKGTQRSHARRYFSNLDSDYIFSFRSVCEHLDIEPQLILDHIHQKGLDR